MNSRWTYFQFLLYFLIFSMYSKQIKIDSTLGSGSRVRSFYVNSSDSHLRKPVDLKTFNRPREPVTTGQGFLFYLFIYLFLFVCLFSNVQTNINEICENRSIIQYSLCTQSNPKELETKKGANKIKKPQ